MGSTTRIKREIFRRRGEALVSRKGRLKDERKKERRRRTYMRLRAFLIFT